MNSQQFLSLYKHAVKGLHAVKSKNALHNGTLEILKVDSSFISLHGLCIFWSHTHGLLYIIQINENELFFYLIP